jgi:hypothetical protein
MLPNLHAPHLHRMVPRREFTVNIISEWFVEVRLAICPALVHTCANANMSPSWSHTHTISATGHTCRQQTTVLAPFHQAWTSLKSLG